MADESDVPEVIDHVQAPAETPAPEAEAPAAEAPPEAAAEDPQPSADDPPEKDRKSPVAQLKGRVGHLTKTIHQKDAELAERDRKIAAYEAMLKGAAPEGEGDPAPSAQPSRSAPVGAAPGTPEFETAVAAELAQREFNAACNRTWEAGNAEFSGEFEESIDNLRALGFMRNDVVEAALATDAAPKVLHFLGQDTEEAARIAQLPPIRMAAEMVKLAAKLAQPAPKPEVSRAPAPITPVGGAASPTLDVYDPNLSDDEYYARRAKQGAPYVRVKTA